MNDQDINGSHNATINLQIKQKRSPTARALAVVVCVKRGGVNSAEKPSFRWGFEAVMVEVIRRQIFDENEAGEMAWACVGLHGLS